MSSYPKQTAHGTSSVGVAREYGAADSRKHCDSTKQKL